MKKPLAWIVSLFSISFTEAACSRNDNIEVSEYKTKTSHGYKAEPGTPASRGFWSDRVSQQFRNTDYFVASAKERNKIYFHVRDPFVAWADYDLIRGDMPELSTAQESDIDQFLLENFAVVSEKQILQVLANTPVRIAYDENRQPAGPEAGEADIKEGVDNKSYPFNAWRQEVAKVDLDYSGGFECRDRIEGGKRRFLHGLGLLKTEADELVTTAYLTQVAVPPQYGRAAVVGVPFPRGGRCNPIYVDIKGTGSNKDKEISQEEGHSNGLMPLHEGIREVLWQRLFQHYIERERREKFPEDNNCEAGKGMKVYRDTIKNYALIYPSFSVRFRKHDEHADLDDRAPSFAEYPAGFLLRQPHVRQWERRWSTRHNSYVRMTKHPSTDSPTEKQVLLAHRSLIRKYGLSHDLGLDYVDESGERCIDGTGLEECNWQVDKDFRTLDFGSVGCVPDGYYGGEESGDRCPFEVWGYDDGNRAAYQDRTAKASESIAFRYLEALGGGPKEAQQIVQRFIEEMMATLPE